MGCYSPLSAYVGAKREGKISVVWNPRDSVRGQRLNLPCGGCLGCRLDKSQMWAMRCWHESQMHERNSFVTLTYDDAHFPSNGSVDVREFQLFMKRLRKFAGSEVRFFHCGEYGEKLLRPHYHALLFGFNFDDLVLHSVRNGNNIYTSRSLDSLWGKGFATVGSVTYQSAGYVARYVLKKITGDKAPEYYGGRAPEYITMSRRPGIGSSWYDRYSGDVFPSDNVVVNGRGAKAPRFYLDRLKKFSSSEYDLVKSRRAEMGRKKAGDNDSFRLPVKEECKRAAIRALSRGMEVSE